MKVESRFNLDCQILMKYGSWRPPGPTRKQGYFNLNLKFGRHFSSKSFEKRSLSKSIYKSIEEKGYAIEPNFLSNERLSELKTITNQIASRERQSGNAYLYGTSHTNQRIYNLISKDKIYRDLLESRLRVSSQLVGHYQRHR